MSQCNQWQIDKLIFIFLQHSKRSKGFCLTSLAFSLCRSSQEHPRGAAQRQLSTNTQPGRDKEPAWCSVTSPGTGTTLQDSPVSPGEDLSPQGCQCQAGLPQEQSQSLERAKAASHSERNYWNGINSSQSGNGEDFHSSRVNLTFCCAGSPNAVLSVIPVRYTEIGLSVPELNSFNQIQPELMVC